MCQEEYLQFMNMCFQGNKITRNWVVGGGEGDEVEIRCVLHEYNSLSHILMSHSYNVSCR